MDTTGAGDHVRLTKGDILAAVESTRSQIQDLTVTFSFNALMGSDENDACWRSHQTITVQGDKTYVDHEYGPLPKLNPGVFHRRAAFNGERSTFYQVNDAMAGVQTSRELETKTKGYGFFDMMLLDPPKSESDGVGDQSLLSVLGSENSRLRQDLENVNGCLCYVVDLFNPFNVGSPKPHLTVWLDPERGFLPVRQTYYLRSGAIIMEFAVEQAIEVGPGLWFAVRGSKKVYNNEETGVRKSEHIMEVDGWKEGRPAIAINKGIAADFFDLWKRLPVGTYLYDSDVGEAWTVEPEKGSEAIDEE
ncbi:MAG: hypothetical protein PHN75_21100 [Syntrophales bacterium]|nr:hypothetical protein [Syntrophales bacterium]